MMTRTGFALAVMTALLLLSPRGARAAAPAADPSPSAPSTEPSVATSDGLSLAFRAADASVAAIRLDGAPVRLNGSPGGFYVVDMIAEKRLGSMDYRSASYPGTRLNATARPSPTGVVVQGEANDLWIRARIENRDGYLSVTGDLVNLRPAEDRAVLLYFRLPIDGEGSRWGRNLGVDETVTGDGRFLNWTHFHQAYRPAMSRLPVATLSGDGWGLTLCQPMDVPRFFRIAYERPHGFQMEYEFGLSPVTWKFRNRAPFRFLLYRHDPRWELRSAFERYYGFFPELFRKVSRDGMWVVYWEQKRGELGDPADYGIVYNETGLWADEDQRSKDVLSMMYIEPWCDHIEATPDRLEEMARDSEENRKEARYGRGADLRTNALQLLNSGIYGRDGKILDPREAAVGGFYVEGTPDAPYYRYITNPDPELPTPFGGMNRAQKIYRYDLYTSWGRETEDHEYEKDGIYYDSIGAAWAGNHLHNFRRDHMPYVDFPLTFDHQSGRVTITHGFSAIEFLRACTIQARNDGRPTMGNASPGYFLPFVAPWLDMGGAGENYEKEDDFAGLKETRALFYQKPLSYLNNPEMADPAFAETVLNRLLLYACYPGAASVERMKADRDLYRKYIPVYNALGAAGWEPVPHAAVDRDGAWVERFGRADGELYFAIRNPGEATEMTLTIDRQTLGLRDLNPAAVTGCRVVSSSGDRIRLSIPARWTGVVAVGKSGGIYRQGEIPAAGEGRDKSGAKPPPPQNPRRDLPRGEGF